MQVARNLTTSTKAGAIRNLQKASWPDLKFLRHGLGFKLVTFRQHASSLWLPCSHAKLRVLFASRTRLDPHRTLVICTSIRSSQNSGSYGRRQMVYVQKFWGRRRRLCSLKHVWPAVWWHTTYCIPRLSHTIQVPVDNCSWYTVHPERYNKITEIFFSIIPLIARDLST